MRVMSSTRIESNTEEKWTETTFYFGKQHIDYFDSSLSIELRYIFLNVFICRSIRVLLNGIVYSEIITNAFVTLMKEK